MKTFLIVFLFGSPLFAAIPNSSVDEQIIYSLRNPHAIALQDLKTLGVKAQERLKEMAFNEKWPLKTRWKAFMVFTHVKGKKSFPFIKKAMVNSTWFMRSAGLTALQSIDPLASKKWAYKLLRDDKALMVRMKALEILKNERSEKITELFWSKIYSKDSVHRNQSLWIRGDIARILVKQPRKKDLKRWVKLLHEKDGDLSQVATVALSKIHDNQNQEAGNVAFWQKRFPKSKKL